MSVLGPDPGDPLDALPYGEGRFSGMTTDEVEEAKARLHQEQGGRRAQAEAERLRSLAGSRVARRRLAGKFQAVTGLAEDRRATDG